MNPINITVDVNMSKLHSENLAQPAGGLSNSEADDFLGNLFPRREVKRVLLVTPPDADASLFRPETALRGRYTNYPPYGLAVLAQHLKSIGVETRVCNLNHEVLKRCHQIGADEPFEFDEVWQSKLDQDLQDFKPDLTGVTCMFTMTHTSFKAVCQRVAASGVPLAIGGVHVTNDVERVLDDIQVADIAFLREGDVALPRFVQVVNREAQAEGLAQVILNDEKAGIRLRCLKESMPNPQDIDVIPAYELLEVPEYSTYGTIGAFSCFKPPKTRLSTVLSNRGCRAQCTFCSVRNFNGSGVRQRSVTSVVDELEVLRNEYGVGHIMWLDDDLLRDHKRSIQLFNEMTRRRLDLTWDATNGVIAASCTEEVIAAAADSGCIAINIGIESGNPAILRQVKKPGTVETFLRAAEVFRKFEQIHTSGLLILGFPGEAMSMVFDTINLARQMDLDWYRVSPLQPLPNTPIYDSMVAQGLIQDIGSKELRFMGGAYGKQPEIERGQHLTSPNFGEAFSSIHMDAVPNSEQLTDIWFYMNYHLNFHRLFTEERAVKMEQLLKHLRVLGDVISPENGFALYFQGYLQHKMFGKVEPGMVERLRERLATSAYWEDRFKAFGLSVEDLENGDYKNKAIPRLAPAGIATSG
jgi:radical SAM superfamily enzyme YgiQ (UPF0313 family)